MEYVKSVGAVVGIIAFIGTFLAFEYHSYGNDPMPLEGKAEHSADIAAAIDRFTKSTDRLGNELKADNVERRIEATCALLAAARDSKAYTLQQGLQIQFAAYQQQHLALTGREYVIAMCQ